jgi:uncharacterized membrane protein YhaH (DUF805 family)
MLILSILLLLFSIAVTLRRDKSILYSRVVIVLIVIGITLGLASLFLNYSVNGVGIYGGLFHTTSFTQIFQIFISIISAIILQLTAFYPRKV